MTPETVAFVAAARVARLATVGEDGFPYLVPFCFVLHAGEIWSALDEKPKRIPVERLRRVRNLVARPQVGVVVDRWSEDWSQLAWVQIRGIADLVFEGVERAEALKLLREKYSQYQAMPVIDRNPTIRITPESVQVWGLPSS
ncbi:MAG: TIGR03668 family PPOX class F420-dependent oxidoreductase [Dehalococcoidia bacterium]